MTLFEQAPHNEPLAARMRPRHLDEYIGQEHIVGPGRLLRRAIQADQLSSLIFYGPPGTGKTTLAQVIAGTTKSQFISLNAVLSGVKQVRDAISEAQDLRNLQARRTILFVDEVHRWNKAQQDALLPWVENGTIILIGATTENPYFEVNSALVSRSRIFQLKALSQEDLKKVALQALNDKARGYGQWKVEFEKGALEHLINVTDGDARSLLNSLQLAVETSPETYPPPPGSSIFISCNVAEESIQKKVVLYDKEGDYHYDTISAFIKSIRGSDPDAALYWMAKMVRAGEDPKYIFRRMIISAAEDIGLADPNALTVVNQAAQSYDRIGLPEGQFLLAEAALYLATAPKSNSTLAFFDALKVVEQEKDQEVPNHLKDSSRDKHGFGHGIGYKYPHAYKDHWVAQDYLPKEINGYIFYQPSQQGYEKQIQQRVISNREEQLQSLIEDTESLETLSFSPNDKIRKQWVRRTEGQLSAFAKELKSLTFQSLALQRHSRVLLIGEKIFSLFWEAYRHCPEGGIVGYPTLSKEKILLEHSIQALPEIERPQILTDLSLEKIDKGYHFDALICNFTSSLPEAKVLKEFIDKLRHKESKMIFIIPQFDKGSHLSDLLKESSIDPKDLNLWISSENQFDKTEQETFSPLVAALNKKDSCELKQEFILSKEKLQQWLDPSRKKLGNYLEKGDPHFLTKSLNFFFKENSNERSVVWKKKYQFFRNF